MRKKAIVVVKGGFGNQLFQYCLANHLKKNNFSVKIDTSFFNINDFDTRNTYRHLSFTPKELGFKKANKFSIIIFNFLRKINKLNIKFLTFEYFKGYNHVNLKFKDFNLFDGYWQNKILLDESKDFLIKYLSNKDSFKENISLKDPKFNTLVHVRRDDYIGMSEELTISYYKESISKMNKMVKDFQYDIFTDDKTWVKNNDVFSDAKNIFDQENFGNEPIATFINMIKYKNFILANSTFSLLASYLKENDDSKIITPTPWFRNIDHPGFLYNNWIAVENI